MDSNKSLGPESINPRALKDQIWKYLFLKSEISLEWRTEDSKCDDNLKKRSQREHREHVLKSAFQNGQIGWKYNQKWHYSTYEYRHYTEEASVWIL